MVKYMDNMAKKKRVRGRVSRSRKVVKGVKNLRALKARSTSSPKKLRVAFKNLLLFLILSIISIALYNISSNLTYNYLFFLLSILFVFLTIALFIAWLVLLILRVIEKNR